MASIQDHRTSHHAGDVRATACSDFFGELLFPDRGALEELDLDELVAEEGFVDGLLKTFGQPFMSDPDQWREVVRQAAEVLSLLAAEVHSRTALVLDRGVFFAGLIFAHKRTLRRHFSQVHGFERDLGPLCMVGPMKRRWHILGLIAFSLVLACDEDASPGTATEAATPVDPFAVRSEDELREQVQQALARARDSNKKVLLEFLADWCEDCREVIRVSSGGPAAEVLARDYEVVYVEVGRLDRHVELIRRYRVERIATLVILDAQGERVAQTTLEPLSNHRPLSSEALAGWLRSPVDAWEGTAQPDEEETPVFPAEIVEPG